MEDDWTVSANDALTISFVRPGKSSKLEPITSFNPRFTYAIFGDKELVFGYKGLKINLKYDARDLRPNLTVSYTRKFTAVGDVEALDIREKLKEFLPSVAFQSKHDYEQAAKDLPKTWVPPGHLLRTFVKNGETYEIWHGTLNDPAVKQLLQRVQIVALFFIEGATYTGEDSEGNVEPDYCLARWSVFFVYKKEVKQDVSPDPQYTFQGYSTVYNFWVFQASALQGDLKTVLSGDSQKFDRLPLEVSSHRMRISQFLILPPFQGKGIGSLLYNTIFEIGMKTQSAMEFAVEDPNEDFDLLRDLCDLKYLRKNVPEFVNLEVNTEVTVPKKGGILHNDTRVTPHREPSGSAVSSSKGIVDLEKLELLRRKTKIAPRQFWRLVEMHLMSKLPESVRPRLDDAEKPEASQADKHAYTLWRLVLKQRVYRRNVSQLGEFEVTERILKLNETVANIEWEYAVILGRLESKPPIADNSATNDGKRKLNGVDDVDMPSSKKART
ncbi:histone acetyl transferase HAT1-like protein [Hypoxylon cercidicola]|nr:histone acetyl transferase HAT1-like protein [Hypoxylon cercidicola]